MMSQWAFALIGGLLIFLVLHVLLHSLPSRLRINRAFWLAELILLPLLVIYFAVLAITVLGLTSENVWHQRIHEIKGVLLALIFAYLANRALTLFVWSGPLRSYTAALPGIVRNLVTFFIYLGAVYAILTYVFGQPVTGLLVSSGIALGVLGLAFQSTLTDIISGISLAVERPFTVGDWIETDSGICGRVETIDWRATTLRTISRTTHIIPNNKIANSSIHNLSRPGPTFCLRVFISVSADIPPDEVCRLLLEAAITAPGVEQDPAPIVRINAAEQRPLKYLTLIHCADYDDHPAVRAAFLKRAWSLLREAGAEIAADTRQVEFRRAEALDYVPPSDAASLAEVELLALLKSKDRERLTAAGHVHELDERQAIVREGEAGDSFFVILSGIVRIFKPATPEQDADLELARLGAGSYFGEMSLLTGERRSASVSAHTKVRLLEIPKAAMADLLARRPKLAGKLAQVMAQRQLATQGLVQSAGQHGFGERLKATTREIAAKIAAFFGE